MRLSKKAGAHFVLRAYANYKPFVDVTSVYKAINCGDNCPPGEETRIYIRVMQMKWCEF